MSLVIPGLTSSSVMMALGLYQPMLEGLARLDFLVLSACLPGMVLTILLLARLVSWFFRKHYSIAFHGIFGIVLASTLVIIPTSYVGAWEIVLSAVCCIGGFLPVSYTHLDVYKRQHLVSVAGVHIEPMGIYAGRVSSLEDLPDGAVIAVPNDATNEGRALLLLEAQGLITLDDSSNLTATPNNIVDNPKNLEFQELEAATIPSVLADVDLAVINSNYALGAGLNPTTCLLYTSRCV